MTYQDNLDFASQVADLNRYGQALNRCETVDEVVSLTLEAMSLLFDTEHSTFVEVRNDTLRVLHSTNPALSGGDEPSDAAVRAYESRETVARDGKPASADPETSAVLAVPALIVDDVTAVLVMRSATAVTFDDAAVRPLEILASHAATAIGNIRSRERLRRAHRDLETRKEMVEMYDRLLRHDLGNDVQIIIGFADALASRLEGEQADYAARIQRAAESSADLIHRVGDIVSTLERQTEPEPRDLRTVLTSVVAENRTRFEDVTIRFDPDEVSSRVYGGKLIDSVFHNLVSNAAVHNELPVEIRIDTEEAGSDEVVVTVADDGSGVPPEIRADLFEMGAKGPDSTGTGFGLGFVRALTESYGGDVTVGDGDDGGAEFRVRLQRV